MKITKLAAIQAELSQIEGVGWYTKYAITQELIKEAGWKENITSGILAALFMVLTGTTVDAASKKTNVKRDAILAALQDAATVNEAISLYKIPMQEKRMTPTQQPNRPDQTIKKPTPMPSSDDVYEFIKSNEGYKNKVYKDPAGNLAIGLGFNLDRPLAKGLFKNMGIDINTVRQGKRVLSEKEIKQLFTYDLNLAVNNAKLFINNFDYIPYEVKMALIDMSYNLGLPRLSKFHNFKTALEAQDYTLAAKEMKNSKWYTQVKGRGEKLANMVANADSETPPTQVASL